MSAVQVSRNAIMADRDVTRRQFMQHSAAAAAVPALAAGCKQEANEQSPARGGGSMGKIKLGINMEFVRHADKSFEWGVEKAAQLGYQYVCLLYTSPSPRDRQRSRMPSSA